MSIELDNKAHYKLEVYIDEVVAYGNTDGIGANIYISVSSVLAHYNIFIKNTLSSLYGNIIVLIDCSFLIVRYGAGLYFQHSSDNATQAYLSVFNSTFSHNNAYTGAGVLYIAETANTVIVRLENCNFLNNTGSVGLALYMIGYDIQAPHSVSGILAFLINVTMLFNQPSNQIVTSSLQSTMTVQNIVSITFDGVSILSSLTTGLILFDSNIIFQGKCTISNNSGIDGGGMALYGTSYMLLNPPVVVSLRANHASRYGGPCMLTNLLHQANLHDASFKLHNLCTILVLLLSKNSAGVAGSALYGGNQLEDCLSQTKFPSVFQLSDQPGPSNISSDPIDICPCNHNDEVICNTYSYSTSAVPGGEFTISVGAVGKVNGLTPATLVVCFSNKSVLVNTSASCNKLAYTLTVTNADQTEVWAIT